MGGWPTVAFLTPKGDLITGTSFLEPGELLELLERVVAFYGGHRDEIEVNLREQWAAKEKLERSRLRREHSVLQPSIVADDWSSILEAYDPEFGGWGKGQEFPHPEWIDFTLVQFAKTRDPKMGEIVVKTLDQMMKGGIHDPVDGGFFRYSTTRDWRVPHFEKVLESNATRLCFYMEAAEVFGREDYLEIGRASCRERV